MIDGTPEVTAWLVGLEDVHEEVTESMLVGLDGVWFGLLRCGLSWQGSSFGLYQGLWLGLS